MLATAVFAAVAMAGVYTHMSSAQPAALPGQAPAGPDGWVPWQFCQVTVVVGADAPDGFAEAAEAAAAEVSAAAGVVFSVAAAPADGAGRVDVDFAEAGPGGLVAAASAAETTLTPPEPGRGHTSARLVVSPSWWSSAPVSGPGSRSAMLVHELAHAAGVGHVDSAASTMDPAIRFDGPLSADTVSALARLAPAGCAPVQR